MPERAAEVRAAAREGGAAGCVLGREGRTKPGVRWCWGECGRRQTWQLGWALTPGASRLLGWEKLSGTCRPPSSPCLRSACPFRSDLQPCCLSRHAQAMPLSLLAVLRTQASPCIWTPAILLLTIGPTPPSSICLRPSSACQFVGREARHGFSAALLRTQHLDSACSWALHLDPRGPSSVPLPSHCAERRL